MSTYKAKVTGNYNNKDLNLKFTSGDEIIVHKEDVLNGIIDYETLVNEDGEKVHYNASSAQEFAKVLPSRLEQKKN